MSVGGINIPTFADLDSRFARHDDEFHYLADLHREPEDSQEGPARGV